MQTGHRPQVEVLGGSEVLLSVQNIQHTLVAVDSLKPGRSGTGRLVNDVELQGMIKAVSGDLVEVTLTSYPLVIK